MSGAPGPHLTRPAERATSPSEMEEGIRAMAEKKSVKVVEAEDGLDFDDESEALVETDAPDDGRGSLASMEVDPNVELVGIWFDMPGSTLRFKVAHGENENYQDYLQQLIRPHLSLVQSNTREGYRFLRKTEAKSKAKHVLVDWEGMTDEGGKTIPYSAEKSLELLWNRKYRKIRRFVDNCSTDESAFGRSEQERQAAGKDW